MTLLGAQASRTVFLAIAADVNGITCDAKIAQPLATFSITLLLPNNPTQRWQNPRWLFAVPYQRSSSSLLPSIH
jgi:hypothetical protein